MESAAGLATMGWFSKGLVYVAGSCFEKSNGGAISSFRKQRYQCGVFHKDDYTKWNSPGFHL